MSVFETDRSAILSFQKCGRDRYYSRHFQGKGLEKVRKSLPLVFGAAFHEGSENLLLDKGVESAVNRALLYLNLAFSVEGVDLEEKQTLYAVEEQKAIAEGLLRAWWIAKGKRFLEDFEVLEVEKEGRATLAGSKVQWCDHCAAQSTAAAFCGQCGNALSSPIEDVPSLVLMFRPDALVRERLTGDLYIVSWKTASTFGQYTLNSIATDMQSMSEVWGVEQTVIASTSVGEGLIATAHHRIEGVLYLFACKGQRRLDDYLGFKVQNTPLAYGWVRKGPTPDEDEWAWQYGWATEEMNEKTGKMVQTKLGKGFRRVPIWSDYPGGVKAWVDALAANEIAPRHINAFEQIFPESLPVSRRADEIESWKRQVVSQELRVKQRTLAVELDTSEEVLDREFPQHTARCFDYNSKCSFFDICFNPAIKSDPIGSGLYSIRTANHPERAGDAE